jgi:predicted anti-sigma-YlaC factor YlaD
MEELTCKELVELVTEYLEGTLQTADRTRFDAHLKNCSGCTTYVQQMRQTIRLVGKLSEETLDPQTKEELLNVFRQWKMTRP